MPGVDGASSPSTAPGPTTTTSDGPRAPRARAPTAPTAPRAPKPRPATAMVVEYDDFGLPIRKYTPPAEPEAEAEGVASDAVAAVDAPRQANKSGPRADDARQQGEKAAEEKPVARGTPDGGEKDNATAAEGAADDNHIADASRVAAAAASPAKPVVAERKTTSPTPQDTKAPSDATLDDIDAKPEHVEPSTSASAAIRESDKPDEAPAPIKDQAKFEAEKTEPATATATDHKHDAGKQRGDVGMSEYSHQQLTSNQAEKKGDDDVGWQVMPAYAPFDMYDDDNKLIATEYNAADDEPDGYAGLGGAGKGYTKVMLDDDAESATSMDENTQYLFKDAGGGTGAGMLDDDDSQRDAVSQLQATKDLLTEGQRIAYVGLTRLELSVMLKEAESIKATSSKTKKNVTLAAESMKMWSQKMMIRLYSHMDISPAEQVMIEQLSAHGVMPQDLTPVLMANARVKNPMAAEEDAKSSPGSSRPTSIASPPLREPVAEPPPPYSADDDSELTAPVRTPSQMPTTQKIDIDIRWTVLCDLFLVLIADSIYDARSRLLLEKVAGDLDISWLDICRFEKKVTDALEMQANAEKENWDEGGHMENRRKMALKRRYMMMGLATVGGGLVIGLSAGLLAPVIGLGLAAGFTTIGIGGTGGFLAGAGGAAIITSSAAASGSIIGVRAANRRTGAVKTFEYRPLNNNKRVNLIVTVSGWMTGKVDDVRLPFSTVDPVMGDIYSVLWEPEMLTSMGDTINILATEALTQGLQQVLGSTILISLMAALQVPVVLTKLAYLIDNPWAVSLDRATMAGLILADSLIDRNLGTRPVTLVGYSLGSRVIFSCLQELAKKGAFGLVQNVFIFGSPVVVKKDEFLRARTVVSGRFINGYNRNDWILGYLFRLTNGGIRRIAGLAVVDDIPGLENMDVSEIVAGHMEYRTAVPRLLRECGWLVESDEFTEIEDPDPDNYQERQRELISEIEEARRELEKEGKASKGGGAFGFFKRKKAPEKAEWEVYEDGKGGKAGKMEDQDGNNHGVLFDVDAIRAEIARDNRNDNNNAADIDEELLQVREIKSTLPPIKLELNPSNTNLTPPTAKPSRQSLRETKSAEPIAAQRQPSPTTTRKSSSSPTPPPPPPPPPPPYSPRSSLSRTPTTPFPASKAETPTTRSSSRSPYHSYGHSQSHGYATYGGGAPHDDDDEVSMTFDTGFDDGDHGLNKPSPSEASGGSAGRPGMVRSAQTVPNITLADPWADEDEEFGKEKEIQMTFA